MLRLNYFKPTFVTFGGKARNAKRYAEAIKQLMRIIQQVKIFTRYEGLYANPCIDFSHFLSHHCLIASA